VRSRSIKWLMVTVTGEGEGLGWTVPLLPILPFSPFLFDASESASLQLAAVGNDDLGGGVSGVGSNGLDPLDDVHALDDVAEDDVLSV